MNKKYIRWATRTGRILDIVSISDTPETFDLYNTTLTETELETIDPSLVQMVDGQLADRPQFSITQDKTEVTSGGSDEVTFTGIPRGSMVSISGPAEMAPAIYDTDEPLKVSVVLPGDYFLIVELFPYVQKVYPFTGV